MQRMQPGSQLPVDTCVHCGYPIVNISRALEDFRARRLSEINEGNMFGISGAKSYFTWCQGIPVYRKIPRHCRHQRVYLKINPSAFRRLGRAGIQQQRHSLVQRNYDNNKPVSCLEINRNGIVEAIDTLFSALIKMSVFSHGPFMDRLVTSCNEVLMLYKLVGIEPPFTLMVSFSGIKDYTVSTKSVHFPGKRAQYDCAFCKRLISTPPIRSRNRTSGRSSNRCGTASITCA